MVGPSPRGSRSEARTSPSEERAVNSTELLDLIEAATSRTMFERTRNQSLDDSARRAHTDKQRWRDLAIELADHLQAVFSGEVRPTPIADVLAKYELLLNPARTQQVYVPNGYEVVIQEKGDS